MVYLMVMNGARGILLYSRRGPNVMPTNTVLWAEYRSIALEFAEISPWLLSNATRPVLEWTSACTTHCHCVEDGKGTTLPTVAESAAFAVASESLTCEGFTLQKEVSSPPPAFVILCANTGNRSLAFSFALLVPFGHGAAATAEAKVPISIEVLFENRLLSHDSPTSNGSVIVRDTIGAMSTRAYRIQQQAPPLTDRHELGYASLVINGDFEAQSSVGVPDTVFVTPRGDLGSTFFVDSRVAASSGFAVSAGGVGHSLRMITPTAGAGLHLSLGTHALASSTNYSLNMMLRTVLMANATFRVGLSSRGDEPNCCDVAPTSILTSLQHASDRPGEWRAVESMFTSPSDCGSSCVLGLELVSNGTVWIDQLVLQAV